MLIKLLLTVLATSVLLVHTQPIDYLAGMAAQTSLGSDDYRGVRIQLVADAGAALLVLITATVLSVYKPRGVPPFGRVRR